MGLRLAPGLRQPRFRVPCLRKPALSDSDAVFLTEPLTLREMLEIFFVIHDPTTLNRQGNDTGTQYRSGIYFSQPEQELVAREVLAEVAGAYGRPVVTELVPVSNYWPAEDYHQDFFERNPQQGYCQAVAAPKVAKFRKTFARLQKA